MLRSKIEGWSMEDGDKKKGRDLYELPENSQQLEIPTFWCLLNQIRWKFVCSPSCGPWGCSCNPLDTPPIFTQTTLDYFFIPSRFFSFRVFVVYFWPQRPTMNLFDPGRIVNTNSHCGGCQASVRCRGLKKSTQSKHMHMSADPGSSFGNRQANCWNLVNSKQRPGQIWQTAVFSKVFQNLLAFRMVEISRKTVRGC